MAVSDRRARDRQRRREEILRAAAEVLAERGVDAASMDAIADRAELGKATLYYYFRTKEELHAAVIADAAERFFAELAGVGRRFATLADLVEALLLAFARFIEGHPDLLRVLAPYLAQMHWSSVGHDPHGPAASGGEPALPQHLAFVAEYDRLLAASPWAGDPDRFTQHLTGLFVSLGRLQLDGHGDQLEPQLRFHVDLIRRYRGAEEDPTP